MNHIEVGRLWNENAEAWTKLARAGYDIYRDYLNTPAFLEMLPEIKGLRGLDIGCGEGHNTRLLAQRGAHMTAIDIAENFIKHAREMEEKQPLGIHYQTASAVELPFSDESFDFTAAFMSMMDIPENDKAMAEAFRVLKPGGFFQFSICHPCFDTPHLKNLRDASGLAYAKEIGDYFRKMDGEIMEWLFCTAPPEAREGLRKFRVPRFTRTLSEWLNLVIDTGFLLERINEPCPSDATIQQCPHLQDAQVVPYFLHIRARKV